MWFGKTIKVERKMEGPKAERTLWLCPDCAENLGTDKRRVAFLREVLKT